MFKKENSKRIAIIAGIVFVVIYAILFLLIQAGYSMDTFSSIGKTFLSVLTPLFIGGLIAYLLNPILRFFERRIFKKMTRPRLRRALSVFLTYLLVILILVGIFSAILPQVISSVQEFGSNIDNYADALQTAVEQYFDDLNAYIDEHPSVRDILEYMQIYELIGKVIEDDPLSLPEDSPPPTVESTVPASPETGTGNLTVSEGELPGQAADGVSDALTEETSGSEIEGSDTAIETLPETVPPIVTGTITDAAPEPPVEEETVPKHELSFEAFSEFLSQKLSTFSSFFTTFVANLADSLLELSFSFINFLKNAILGIFISIYLLLSKERVAAQCKRFVVAFFPRGAADEVLRITKNADKTVGRFLVGTIIDAVIVAIVTLIFLTIFNIRYALLISLIIGITNMIPFFGPFIGAIPSAILLLIDDITVIINNPGEPVRFSCITFILLILVIQQIDGNIINPRVIGNSTGLSSLGVILSVAIMSGFFGFFGMLLGVPVAAIIISIGKEITEKRLAKKGLPISVASYYAENAAVPPETPEELQEHSEHTAFYRGMVSLLEKLRHVFRKLLYRNHGESRSLRVWVKMKLGMRNVRHKVNHTIHHHTAEEDDKSGEAGSEEGVKHAEDSDSDPSANQEDSDNES